MEGPGRTEGASGPLGLEAFQGLIELLKGEGLFDDVSHAQAPCLINLLGGGAARDHNHRQAWVSFPDLAQDVDAAHLGHDDVEENRVGAPLVKEEERLLAAAGHDGLVTLKPHGFGQQVRDVDRVLNNQDPHSQVSIRVISTLRIFRLQEGQD